MLFMYFIQYTFRVKTYIKNGSTSGAGVHSQGSSTVNNLKFKFLKDDNYFPFINMHNLIGMREKSTM